MRQGLSTSWESNRPTVTVKFSKKQRSTSGDTFREDNKKEMTMKRMTENVASGIGVIKFGLSRLSHFRLRTILRVTMKTRTTTTEIPKRNTPDQIE